MIFAPKDLKWDGTSNVIWLKNAIKSMSHTIARNYIAFQAYFSIDDY